MYKLFSKTKRFQLTAARRRLVRAVLRKSGTATISTHSRAKAAGWRIC